MNSDSLTTKGCGQQDTSGFRQVKIKTNIVHLRLKSKHTSLSRSKSTD